MQPSPSTPWVTHWACHRPRPRRWPLPNPFFKTACSRPSNLLPSNSSSNLSLLRRPSRPHRPLRRPISPRRRTSASRTSLPTSLRERTPTDSLWRRQALNNSTIMWTRSVHRWIYESPVSTAQISNNYSRSALPDFIFFKKSLTILHLSYYKNLGVKVFVSDSHKFKRWWLAYLEKHFLDGVITAACFHSGYFMLKSLRPYADAAIKEDGAASVDAFT